jgi:hypothetical protein
MLTVAVGLAADHPITISGGSPLRLQHDSWDQKDDRTLGSKVHDSSVTAVEISSDAGALPAIAFNGEPLELHLTYGTIKLTITTGPKGEDPTIQVDEHTSLKKHFRRRDNNTFESVKSNATIQGLTVSKGGAAQSLGAISGHTVIVIRY